MTPSGLAGPVCMAGGAGWTAFGLAGVADATSAWHPAVTTTAAVAILGCLSAGPLGLLAHRAAGSGWAGKAGLAGAAVALLGLLSYVTSSISELAIPEGAFVPAFAALGALLTGGGMLALGIAVLAARRMEGWRAVAPFGVGFYYAVMMPFQIILFIIPTGRPSMTLLAFWGATWMLLGCSLITKRETV